VFLQTISAPAFCGFPNAKRGIWQYCDTLKNQQTLTPITNLKFLYKLRPKPTLPSTYKQKQEGVETKNRRYD